LYSTTIEFGVSAAAIDLERRLVVFGVLKGHDDGDGDGDSDFL